MQFLFSPNELKEKGFFPQKNYKWGEAFPKGFKLPEVVAHNDFKKLPLYVKVCYEYYATDGLHKLTV